MALWSPPFFVSLTNQILQIIHINHDWLKIMGEATLAHPSAMAPEKNEKFSVDPLVFPSHAPPKIT
jgi:hypothetical protein